MQPRTDNAKLVNGPRLLELLFDKDSRPSLRWLRGKTKEKTIPHFRVGHFVFFDVEKVRAALEQKNG